MKQGVKEFHDIVKVSGSPKSFQEQLDYVVSAVSSLLEGRTALFVRFFLSDVANQQAALEKALLSAGISKASIIQQPPLDGSKISAWVWSVEGTLNPSYSHHVVCGMVSNMGESYAQMDDIFANYENRLESSSMTIADNCIRTWIFVRDVDTNYQGVVEGRRNSFERFGLTPETHYIASTGIQGNMPDCRNLVQMDAYAVKGLLPSQISYLSARSHLNPTYEYGVTFERGTAVTYGDRKHVFISGTASINNKGEILYPGDVVKQTSRMIENVEVLLSEAGSDLSGVKMSVVYLRDGSDYDLVKEYFDANYPSLNPVFVLAPVCRPGWLIEMECISILEDHTPAYPPFLVPKSD